jgi:protein tyrosine phosphatase (PTP) superfamily phosphohydrolase (DUF442 family)
MGAKVSAVSGLRRALARLIARAATLLAAALLALIAVADESGAPWRPERLEVAGVPNVVRLHERILSGGQPAGDAAFAALARLGVKTIITVDGATPDVALARKHGMTYVHLPHGYDGVPAGRAAELAKAVRDLPGPIYIHCHHGKHRSPAAATVACVGAGLLAPERALAVLKTAGASPNYRGLFHSAESARPLGDAALDALAVRFVPVSKIPPLAEAMVQVEHTHDHLKALSDNGWQPLASQPDLDPAHEALLLREHYRELGRTEDAQNKPAAFRQFLANAEAGAAKLEESLRAWRSRASRTATKSPAPPAVRDAMAAVNKACTTCHQRFRDVPLDEKRR